MAASPQYVSVPKTYTANLSTANPTRDGTTGTYATIMTAGTNGSRVDKIIICATGTTTAGMIRFFLNDSLIKETPVAAVTPSATTQAWSAEVTFDGGLILGSGAVLKASTEKSEAFKVTVVNGGDF
jgi:hypothetical protein